MKKAIVVACCLLALGCAKRAGVKLVIHAEEGLVPGEVDTLRVTYKYFGNDGEEKWERQLYAVDEMPQTIIVYKGSTYDYEAKFWVDAFKGNAWRIAAWGYAEFPDSGVKTIELWLQRSCLDMCLSSDQYCSDGECQEGYPSDPPGFDARTDGEEVVDARAEEGAGEDVPPEASEEVQAEEVTDEGGAAEPLDEDEETQAQDASDAAPEEPQAETMDEDGSAADSTA